MRHRSLWVALLSIPCLAVAAEGDGVLITLTGPLVPYAEVVIELRERDETVRARITKRFAHPFGRQEAVGLLTRDALSPVLDQLSQLDLPPQPPKGASAHYAVTIRRDARDFGGFVTLDVPGPALETIQAVRRTVEEACSPLAFQDALLLPSEAGLLRLSSDPPATLEIDGRRLPGTTPISALRLPAGPHSLRLTPLDGGASQVYPFTIEVGKTTQLNLILR